MKTRDSGNRLRRCPRCHGALLHDKYPYTSAGGCIYRARRCSGCGAVVHSKQQPEELVEVCPPLPEAAGGRRTAP
ncbi:hypothetical protein LJC59_04275 [Desulfovibrio sp. OttesenSCG-928-A18]|nr:hypothetical protein [Desulfovibrio sp. OttesenSCG-928-A18]